MRDLADTDLTNRPRGASPERKLPQALCGLMMRTVQQLVIFRTEIPNYNVILEKHQDESGHNVNVSILFNLYKRNEILQSNV